MNAVTHVSPDYFIGTFNGGDFTISNLSVSGSSWNGVGLINNLGAYGIIHDLHLTVSAITNTLGGTGAFAGNAYLGATIQDSSATGVGGGTHLDSIQGHVGGLIGYVEQATIIRSSSNLNVDASGAGSDYAGGLVGYLDRGYVIDSFSLGNISATDAGAGGLVGRMISGQIQNSYASTVVGGVTFGGVVGVNGAGNTYANNYWNTDIGPVNAYNGSGGSVAGQIEGKSAAQLILQATFNTWNFASVWTTSGDTLFPEHQ